MFIHTCARFFYQIISDNNQLLDDGGFVDRRRLPRSCPVDIAPGA
jgi:hypothetical protein